MPPRAVMARREAEFAAAATKADVDRLQQQWIDEDRQREQAATPRASEPALMRRLAAAEQRIAALEQFNRVTLPDGIGKALADLHFEISKTQSADSVRAVVGECLATMYQGVWDVSRKFTQGALVTSDGSLWIALVGSTGLRPGSSNGAWRLVAKGYQPPARKKDLDR